MPLGGSKSISDEGTAQSALAELTPLEWRSETPESEVDEVLTRHLISHVLLGWIDGIYGHCHKWPCDQPYEG